MTCERSPPSLTEPIRSRPKQSFSLCPVHRRNANKSTAPEQLHHASLIAQRSTRAFHHSVRLRPTSTLPRPRHPYCLPHHTTSCDSFKSRFTPHSQNSLSSRHLNILTRRKSPPPPFCPALLSTFLSLSTARNPAQPADAKASYENPSAQRKLHKLLPPRHNLYTR